MTSFRVDANETITGYQYDCTEKDFWWGVLKTVFIFLPGPMLVVKKRNIGWQWLNLGESWQLLILKWLLAPFFPLVLLLVKLGSLFNNGEEWQKLDKALTMIGNDVVRFAQLVLQLYVIFTKATRWPTLVQQIQLVKG